MNTPRFRRIQDAVLPLAAILAALMLFSYVCCDEARPSPEPRLEVGPDRPVAPDFRLAPVEDVPEEMLVA